MGRGVEPKGVRRETYIIGLYEEKEGREKVANKIGEDIDRTKFWSFIREANLEEIREDI